MKTQDFSYHQVNDAHIRHHKTNFIIIITTTTINRATKLRVGHATLKTVVIWIVTLLYHDPAKPRTRNELALPCPPEFTSLVLLPLDWNRDLHICTARRRGGPPPPSWSLEWLSNPPCSEPPLSNYRRRRLLAWLAVINFNPSRLYSNITNGETYSYCTFFPALPSFWLVDRSF